MSECTKDYCELDLEDTKPSGLELIDRCVSSILKASTAICDTITTMSDGNDPSLSETEMIHALSESVNLLTSSLARFGYEDSEEEPNA